MPAGRDDVVIFNGAVVIASDSGAVADTDALSVTFTVKLAVPAVVGVPEMVPLVLRLSPAGSEPVDTVHVYGGEPPVAASGWE